MLSGERQIEDGTWNRMVAPAEYVAVKIEPTEKEKECEDKPSGWRCEYPKGGAASEESRMSQDEEFGQRRKDEAGPERPRPYPDYQECSAFDHLQPTAKQIYKYDNRDYYYQGDLFGRQCGYGNLEAQFSQTKDASFHEPFEGYQAGERAEKHDKGREYSELETRERPNKRDGFVVLSRANVVASPGNSCIVSSTDASHFPREAQTETTRINEASASVMNNNRQEVTSSTRCDSSVQPRPDAVSTTATTGARRGSLQLWQFLVALLDEPAAAAGCIAWTGRGLEFKLLEPEEVARRWGMQKNRPAMNYDKLSRSLRYYYEKGIMQKVAGERYVYKFVCDPDALFNMAYGPHQTNSDISHIHPTKIHPVANPPTHQVKDNPEDLCLKTSCQQGTMEKAHQSYSSSQNYDMFSTLYNGSHHLNYHGQLSLQQYLGVSAAGHLPFDQQPQQHDYNQPGQNVANWNLARYYHQNQAHNYDS